MALIDIWFRPWALFDRSGRHYLEIADHQAEFVCAEDCAPILVTDAPGGPVIGGKIGQCELLVAIDDKRTAWLPPLPLKRNRAQLLQGNNATIQIALHSVPDAPLAQNVHHDDHQHEPGAVLMARVRRVWTRLRDIEEVLSDPATMWKELATIWLSSMDDTPPRMDEIVKQARALPKVIERLDKTPRRILRRVHKQVPLSRVQELDRRSMTWLIRQPGDSISQQAGDRQRIMAVSREENFNTLENRVLLAYARLAQRVASEYAPTRNKGYLVRGREAIVRAYGKRCRQLSKDLISLGVSEAPVDVTPNFVLLNNPDYAAIWHSWRALLDRKRILDELWKWQALSWNEFCALSVIIALQNITGARIVASSPIIFRPEQLRGRWIDSINPLGVVHLTDQQLIIEVVYDYRKHGFPASCTPLVIRFGKIGDERSLLQSVLIWPSWNAGECELDELLDDLLSLNQQDFRNKQRSISHIAGMLVMAPTDSDVSSLKLAQQRAAVSLGPCGAALRGGIENLSAALLHLLQNQRDT